MAKRSDLKAELAAVDGATIREADWVLETAESAPAPATYYLTVDWDDDGDDGVATYEKKRCYVKNVGDVGGTEVAWWKGQGALNPLDADSSGAKTTIRKLQEYARKKTEGPVSGEDMVDFQVLEPANKLHRGVLARIFSEKTATPMVDVQWGDYWVFTKANGTLAFRNIVAEA